jgi:hypothetical protein
MERRRPNRELKNSEDVQDALIEDYFRHDDLSRMEADDILMNISEIESPNYEYVELETAAHGQNRIYAWTNECHGPGPPSLESQCL